MVELKHYVIVGNRKHGYTLQPSRKLTLLICKSANIEERIRNEDVPQVLAELPRIIIRAKTTAAPQSEVLRFRATAEEKETIEQYAHEAGFENVSAYLRAVALQEYDNTS